jgi:hypothetical protein
VSCTSLSQSTSLTASAIYTLPVMCSGDNCGIDIRPFVMAAACVDLTVIDGKRLGLHFTPGIMSTYSVFDGGIFESPSDRPAIWPVINLGLSM